MSQSEIPDFLLGLAESANQKERDAQGCLNEATNKANACYEEAKRQAAEYLDEAEEQAADLCQQAIDDRLIIDAWKNLASDPVQLQNIANKICQAAFRSNPAMEASPLFKAEAQRALDAFGAKVYQQVVGDRLKNGMKNAGAVCAVGGLASAELISIYHLPSSLSIFSAGLFIAAFAGLHDYTDSLREGVAEIPKRKFMMFNNETLHAGFQRAMLALFADQRFQTEISIKPSFAEILAQEMEVRDDLETAIVGAIRKNLGSPPSEQVQNMSEEVAATADGCAVTTLRALLFSPKTPAAQPA